MSALRAARAGLSAAWLAAAWLGVGGSSCARRSVEPAPPATRRLPQQPAERPAQPLLSAQVIAVDGQTTALWVSASVELDPLSIERGAFVVLSAQGLAFEPSKIVLVPEPLGGSSIWLQLPTAHWADPRPIRVEVRGPVADRRGRSIRGAGVAIDDRPGPRVLAVAPGPDGAGCAESERAWQVRFDRPVVELACTAGSTAPIGARALDGGAPAWGACGRVELLVDPGRIRATALACVDASRGPPHELPAGLWVDSWHAPSPAARLD